MLAKALSCGILGIEAYPVQVEVDISRGLPVINLVGMADTAVKESRERVKTAIKNSGFKWPAENITISLSPSDIKKEGSSFDLAIALGILAASEQIDPNKLDKYCFLGELSLDGNLRPVNGVLPCSISLPALNNNDLVLPAENAAEAVLVNKIRVWPQKSLKETVEFIHNPQIRLPYNNGAVLTSSEINENGVDFAEVKGQYLAKRAIEVAAAGGHNILMIGPPGTGKTMLAKRITTIMPDLDSDEALEITKIHSVMGLTNRKCGIINTRPFRSPHHSISNVAFTGGGSIPHPGEISLAHQGVLFLDELPEFPRSCLESMRQPLEEGVIRISRARKSLFFPASFMLVAAMNPCPCGYYTDPKKTCRCNPNKISNYTSKISGPLLDRIDIHIELPAIQYKELSDTTPAESSRQIKGRVETARLLQRERFKDEAIFSNAQMGAKLVRKYCRLNPEAQGLLKMAMQELGLSARAYDKILKISRTIADLAGADVICAEHIAEAVQYRSLDKQL